MESFLRYNNLNEFAIRQVKQPDGTTVEISTQHDAERALITHGQLPTKSGSTLPDLHVHLPDGSKVNAEVKSGRNIDIAQMAVNMDPEGKEVTFSGPTAKKATAGLEAHGIAKRIMNHLGRRVGSMVDHHTEAQSLASQHHDFLTDKHKEYTQQYLDQGHELKAAKAESIKQINKDHPEEANYVHTSSKEIRKLKPMGASLAHMIGGGQSEIRKKMDNKMVHEYMHNYEDPVQKHIHQGTGEIAVFPVSNEHRKHTDQMGLKGQSSLEDIVKHKDERRSSLGVFARLRRKETRGSLSLTGDSSHFVDAVKRRGGTVFANADEYKAHVEEHGYKVKSGQFPNEPQEETSVKESIQKLVEYSLGSGMMSNVWSNISGDWEERKAEKAATAKAAADAAAKKKADVAAKGGGDAATTGGADERREDETEDEPIDTPVDVTPAPMTDEDGDGISDFIQRPEDGQQLYGTTPAGEKAGSPETQPATQATNASVTVNQASNPTPIKPQSGTVPPEAGKQGPRKQEVTASFTMPGMDYFAENIKTTFLDYLKEKNIDLGIRGMLGDPILKDPKKKKIEEAAMRMFAPIAYRMVTESRSCKDKLINNKDSKDSKDQ